MGPNLAFAPTQRLPDVKPSQGQVTNLSLTRRTGQGVGQAIVPRKAQDVFIAPNANVMGDVSIGAKSSIW